MGQPRVCERQGAVLVAQVSTHRRQGATLGELYVVLNGL